LDDPSLIRSRAEALFAALLVEDQLPSLGRVRALGEAHPELAGELERLHVEVRELRARLPGWATPAGETQGAQLPPDLGNFRCLRLLGRGGMGEVWEAEDRALGRRVALKVLRDDLATASPAILRFEREAQAASRVQHPGIVAVHQAGELGGRRYIVQELVPGGRTLRDEFDDAKRLPALPEDYARSVAARFAELADALAAAHAAGIVHRDLKPQNVLVTPGGAVKVADFGLALLAGEIPLSRTGEFVGTFAYSSPEQLGGTPGAADERSDIFSLGATLYEALTLRRAFDGDSLQQIARAVSVDDPPAPHALRSLVPVDLSLVCMKALEKRPAARYGSMAELRDDLRRFLAHRPVRARAPSVTRRAAKWSRRHPTLAATLSLSLAASAGFGGLFLRSESLRREVSEANRNLRAVGDDLRVQRSSLVEVNTFLIGMFDAANPDVSGDRPPSVRELVDRAVARIERGEVEDPAVRAGLLSSLGAVVHSLGDWSAARELLEQGLAAWATAGRTGSREEAETLLTLVYVLGRQRDVAALEQHLGSLLARVGRDRGLDVDLSVRVLLIAGKQAAEVGRFDEVEALLDRADTLCAELPADHGLRLNTRSLRAGSYWQQGRLEDARALFQEILDENPDRLARAQPSVLEALNGLGLILFDQRRFAEAEALLRDLCERSARSMDADHPDLLVARVNLARVWEAQERYVEAERDYREIVQLLSARSGPESSVVLQVRNNLGTCLVRQGRFAEAEEVHRDVWELRRERFPEDRPTLLNCQNNLAYDLYRLGRFEEALSLQEEVVDLTPAEDPHAVGRRQLLDSIRQGSARQ